MGSHVIVTLSIWYCDLTTNVHELDSELNAWSRGKYMQVVLFPGCLTKTKLVNALRIRYSLHSSKAGVKVKVNFYLT